MNAWRKTEEKPTEKQALLQKMVDENLSRRRKTLKYIFAMMIKIIRISYLNT